MTNKLLNGWEEAPLFKYLELVPSGVKQFKGTKKYIDTGSLETGKIRDGVEVDYATKPSRANMQVREGDVLFAKMKDTEKVYLITKDDIAHLYSTGFAILRVKDKAKLLPKYIHFWLRTNDFQRLKNKESTGATQKAINETKLKNFKIEIPPIKMQERIVALLEKAEQIKSWRKEADGLSKDFATHLFFTLFGDIGTNEKGFIIKKLDEVKNPNTDITYGIVQAGPHVANGIPYIKTGDMMNGTISTEKLAKTSKEINAKYKRSEVHKGDLVYSIRATVGTVALLPDVLDGSNLTQGTAKISPGPDVNVSYLLWFLRSAGCQTWIKSRIKGATFKEITLGTLRETPIMVPPRKLQDKFADIVNKMDSIRNLQQSNTSDSNNLFNLLMQKAFKGELA